MISTCSLAVDAGRAPTVHRVITKLRLMLSATELDGHSSARHVRGPSVNPNPRPTARQQNACRTGLENRARTCVGSGQFYESTGVDDV